eukprot:4592419-Amphidinium_carterae.2
MATHFPNKNAGTVDEGKVQAKARQTLCSATWSVVVPRDSCDVYCQGWIMLDAVEMPLAELITWPEFSACRWDLPSLGHTPAHTDVQRA